jgi:hypothetical protein
MNNETVYYIARIYAIQAEIEAMKAFNTHRLDCGYSIGYEEEAFLAKAQELNNIAEQIQNNAEYMVQLVTQHN